METLRIQPTQREDVPAVMAIYDHARFFMRTHGNAAQWIDGYPSQELIIAEVEAGHSFVCKDEDNEIVGTFCYIEGNDPTYRKIYDGAWLDEEPYAVIHRMASSGKRKGIGEACFRWALAHNAHIRVDTHADNHVMQRLLAKLGFQRCGIIFVSNGTPRIAYQNPSR